ncbi:hypothetical protein HDU79_000332 [Rhizoclosmatium sp. JEL0117]|nr:hypothetical protein HDU79_000332 [Rhizoclosmatium sp. JEL0117]
MQVNPSKQRPLSQAVTQSLSQTVIISAKLNNEEAVHLAAGLVSRGLDVSLLDLSESDKKLEKTVKTNAPVKKQIAVLVSAPFAAMERIERWADAMMLTAPGHPTRRATSDSARIHLLVQFLIASKEDGGCGIKVDGTNTDLIIIHDAEWEKLWLSTWSKKWLLDASDFSSIQRYLGEEIAMYFAFINHFLVALIPLASVGVLAHLFLTEYSAYYAVFLTLWGVTFLVSWKRQESSLAEMWHSKPESPSWKRPEFKSDQSARQGIVPESYSFWKRWIVHIFLTGPIVLLFAGLVALASAVILMMQVYTADFYDGPYKSVVVCNLTVQFK